MVACFKLLRTGSLLILVLAVGAQVWLKYGDQRQFNNTTTADEAAADVDLTGKIAIVTGSNTGIGKPTARVLAAHGATVIMACRNRQKAETAKADMIRKLTDPSDAAINFKQLTQ